MSVFIDFFYIQLSAAGGAPVEIRMDNYLAFPHTQHFLPAINAGYPVPVISFSFIAQSYIIVIHRSTYMIAQFTFNFPGICLPSGAMIHTTRTAVEKLMYHYLLQVIITKRSAYR